MDAWLTFLCEDEPGEIEQLIQQYPKFIPMYEDIYQLCRNMEKVMGLYSKELQMMDRNTVQFMIDEQEELIEKQREQLNRMDEELAQKSEQLSQKDEQLSQKVESLTGQVAAGSVIKARGLRIEAYNSSDKVTDRSSRVVRLLTSLSLVENDLAPRGPVTVYIRVKDPDGIILTNSRRVSFNFNGETLVASASRRVDYEGSEVDLSIYLNEIPSFNKGVYTVEAYTEQSLLGTAELMLR